MTRVALVYAVIAIAAFWAGTQLGAKDAAPPSPPAPRAVERAAVAATGGLDTDDIRDVVRAELERQRAPESAEMAPPEAQPRSATEATAIIEAGIRDGTWSASERDTLRVELAQLAPAEIDAVLIPLFQAINAQRVRLDGPPI